MSQDASDRSIHLGREEIIPLALPEDEGIDPDEEEISEHNRKTNMTLLLQFIHSVLCVAMTLTFIRKKKEEVGPTRNTAYRMLTAICTVNFFFISSVFYMWSKRTKVPARAHSRLVKGLLLHLLLSDLPIFVIELDMVVNVGFLKLIFTLAFVITTTSFMYTLMSLWGVVLGYLTRRGARAYGGMKRTMGRGTAAVPHNDGGDPRGVPSGYELPAGGHPLSGGDDLPEFMKGNNDDLYTKYHTPPRASRPAGGIIPASERASMARLM